jgi:ribosomal protein L30E
MKHIFIVLGFVSFIQTVKAQDERIVIIDKNAGKEYIKTKKTKNLVENTSVLKFSPMQMAIGEINFGYERKVSDYTSLDFEFGPTLSNVGLSIQGNHNVYIDPVYGYSQETTGLGGFISVGYRFYPLDNGMVLNGFYVSPVVKYRRMNFGITDYSNMLDDTRGNENDLHFTFNFGFQKWISNRFSLDFYGGMGLSYETHTTYNVSTNYDDVTGTYLYSWNKNAYNGVRFILTGGVKVGFGN